MFVLGFKFLGMLKNSFGIFLRNLVGSMQQSFSSMHTEMTMHVNTMNTTHPTPTMRVFNFLDCFNRFEFNQKDDWIHLVDMESVNGFQMNVEDTMLVL